MARSASIVTAAIVVSSAIFSLSQSRVALGAGAAYQVDTAEVSEPGSCKTESWVSSATNHDFIAAVTPTCVVDMFRAVELSAQFNRSRADGEWASGVLP